MKKAALIVFAVIASLQSFAVGAGGLLTVPPGFRTIGKQCGVPGRVLLGVSMTETETAMKDGSTSIWPYSINHLGKSFHYPSRKAMYDAVTKLIQSGNRVVDVGLMQVNWRWHSHRVNNNLWILTDPSSNVRIACEILKEGFEARGDWVEAAGYYHSPNNKVHARNYMRKFRVKLARIRE